MVGDDTAVGVIGCPGVGNFGAAQVKRILFIDVETTGTDPRRHELIEYAFEYYVETKLSDKFSASILPSWEKDINLKALNINKYNLVTAWDDPKEMWSRDKGALKLAHFLLAVAHDAGEERITIAGHNVGFDIAFLKEFLRRSKITGLDEIFNYNVIDTSVIAHFLKDTGHVMPERINLKNLAGCLKVKVKDEDLHIATVDVNVTAQCYFKMVEMSSI